ncbi:MAG: PilN domain-containing protein [Gammaproteobacteria bacterium]|nr:PilN domain-containing protein [Gammaproteobacteria bacterium]
MSDVRINLLPWRQRLAAKRRRKYFIALAACAVLPGAVVAMLAWHTRAQVNELRAHISILAEANQAATDVVADQTLLAGHIEELQAWQVELNRLERQRSTFVSLWTELARLLPDSIHYQHLMLEDHSLEIQGFTASSPDLATYLRRLETSQVLDSPRLIDLKDEASGKRFGVQATLRIEAPAVPGR